VLVDRSPANGRLALLWPEALCIIEEDDHKTLGISHTLTMYVVMIDETRREKGNSDVDE